MRQLSILQCVFACVLMVIGLNLAWAHGVTAGDAAFIESVTGVSVGPWLYLGAKHMVTGYDHLLFLLGVVFLLGGARDVLVYVTLFSIGHSLTLTTGVLADIRADAYLIDAVIGLSVVYKALDNLGGFERLVGWRPWPKVAVFAFGLCHGFGLATKLQDLEIPTDGLMGKLLLFNAGVELGQLLALAGIVLVVLLWRQTGRFTAWAVAANVLLMMLGFLLTGYQLLGYLKAA
ncbi:MAG: HupE/UreJ family protein [Pseudomonadota bacterium]